MFIILRKMFDYFFSGYLLAKCPVVHRPMGCGRVVKISCRQHGGFPAFTGRNREYFEAICNWTGKIDKIQHGNQYSDQVEFHRSNLDNLR
jgi:hypothetical protein